MNVTLQKPNETWILSDVDATWRRRIWAALLVAVAIIYGDF